MGSYQCRNTLMLMLMLFCFPTFAMSRCQQGIYSMPSITFSLLFFPIKSYLIKTLSNKCKQIVVETDYLIVMHTETENKKNKAVLSTTF